MLVVWCSLAGPITHLKSHCEAALVSAGYLFSHSSRATSVPLLAALCVTLRHFNQLKGKKADLCEPGLIQDRLQPLSYANTQSLNNNNNWSDSRKICKCIHLYRASFVSGNLIKLSNLQTCFCFLALNRVHHTRLSNITNYIQRYLHIGMK